MPEFFQGYKFNWGELSIEEKVQRAENKAHVECKMEEMEPQMTNHVFDFYGIYTRISELQKFRYAENKVSNHYKHLVQEVMYKNFAL